MSIFKLKKAMRISGKSKIKLMNETGLSLSTIYRYLSGKQTYFGTEVLLEMWADRQLSK